MFCTVVVRALHSWSLKEQFNLLGNDAAPSVVIDLGSYKRNMIHFVFPSHKNLLSEFSLRWGLKFTFFACLTVFARIS
jgi:hypothetical protein